jgi:hypothetical protein
VLNFGRVSVLASVLALMLGAARATPTLIGEFSLIGSLANNVPGGPALVLLPFSGVSGTVTAGGYLFAKNQGLTFTSPSLTSTSYTVEFSFKSNIDSSAAWSKLLDLSGVGSNDGGLYMHSNGGQRLQFYNVAESSSADFTANTTVDVALTRDGATKLVVGYVNGVQRFSFTDGSNAAVITASGNTLTFFSDDNVQSHTEASSGTLFYARIYDGALTSTQIAALYAVGAPSAIPEPGATAAWLGLAGLGICALRRRARR